MQPFVSLTDLFPIIPELIIGIAAAIAVFVDLFVTCKEQRTTALMCTTLGGLFCAFFAEINLYGSSRVGFYGTIVADDFSILFECAYLLVGAITVMLSRHYLKENEMQYGEYYVLILSSILGMMLMTSSRELLLTFVGLEIMSISSYIMVGMKRNDTRAGEAALKYLLLGAFSTGFLLYGISLLYGATGSTYIPKIIEVLQQDGILTNPLPIAGITLIFIGLGFKVAVVPFHMWTPDVYTGAPIPVTGFLSAAAKAAGFAVFVRVLLTGMPLHLGRWDDVLWIIAVMTMTLGNLMALKQENVIRMLAYSSVAHAGYVMIAVVVGSELAMGSIIFYSFVYAGMGVGAFGVLSIRRQGKIIETFEDLNGYGKENLWISGIMTMFIFSLIGLPLTGGFIGKLQIFSAALESGWVWLTLVGVLNSALSVYYYLKVVVHIYIKVPNSNRVITEPPIIIPKFAMTGLVIAALFVMYLGIFPEALMDAVSVSVRVIL